MTAQDNNNTPQPFHPYAYADDEIDLMELLAILWNGKWLIGGITLVCAVAAYLYLSMMAESVYRVDAQLNSTSTYHLQRLQPSRLNGGGDYQVSAINLNSVYSSALAYAQSLYVKRLFWSDRSGQELATLSVAEEAGNKEFKAFANGLSVSPPDSEQQTQFSKMSLESAEPTKATQLLGDYIGFVDYYTINEFVDQLQAGYDTSLSRLDADYQSLKEREKTEIEDELVRLQEALNVADALNIVETPYDEIENIELGLLENRLYLLGTRALSEEINALRSRLEKPLASFVPRLRRMEHWREQMEQDLARLDQAAEMVRAYVVVSPPQSTLEPVKPNKLLIFVGIIFLAGFVSVIIVFLRHGIRAYQARTQETAGE